MNSKIKVDKFVIVAFSLHGLHYGHAGKSL